MRILVTGSRDWTDRFTVEVAIRKVVIDRWPGTRAKEFVVVHGDANGADACADASARAMGIPVERHPADWKRFGGKAGPIRNAEMVARGADVCLAFWTDPESRGTTGCAAKARRAGIPVVPYGNWPRGFGPGDLCDPANDVHVMPHVGCILR